jgi:hypothetical protein
MALIRGVSDRLSTIGELVGVLQQNGRWWAIPAVVLVVVLGLVLAGLQAIPYVAPFIYTVF